MKRHVLMTQGSVILVLAVLLICLPVMGQRDPASVGMSRQQADAMIAELKAIRELITSFPVGSQGKALERNSNAITKRLNLNELPVLGSINARVTIAEFFDYQCPFCRDFHASTFELIKKEYIDSGRVRFISVDLPLAMHANAEKAAEASHCGEDQGKFWEVRNKFSLNPERLGPANLINLIKDVVKDSAAFQACIDSKKYETKVENEVRLATAANITVTPSFVIGLSTPSGVEGITVVGAQPLAVFEAAIKEAEKLQ